MPEDPLTVLRGAHAGPGPTTQAARAAERAAEVAGELHSSSRSVTVLDAYAVLAYLRGETAAGPVSDLLRSPSVLSAVNAAEVLDQLVRVLDGGGGVFAQVGGVTCLTPPPEDARLRNLTPDRKEAA